MKITSQPIAFYEHVPCKTNLPKSDLAPLEFLIKGYDNSLINSRDIQLAITVSITAKSRTETVFKKMPADHHLVPINGFLHTVSEIRVFLPFEAYTYATYSQMFEEVEVYVNNVLLDTTLRSYQLQVYKNLLFHTSLDEKEITLKGSLWAREPGSGAVSDRYCRRASD